MACPPPESTEYDELNFEGNNFDKLLLHPNTYAVNFTSSLVTKTPDLLNTNITVVNLDNTQIQHLNIFDLPPDIAVLSIKNLNLSSPPIGWRFLTRCYEINMEGCPQGLTKELCLMGNLRILTLPNGYKLEYDELSRWQHNTYDSYSSELYQNTLVSGFANVFVINTSLLTSVKCNKIYLFGDVHTTQEYRCDPSSPTPTAIEYFAGWLASSPKPISFMAEAPTVRMLDKMNQKKPPHSINGTSRWIKTSNIQNVNYVPWDVRWELIPDIQNNIHYILRSKCTAELQKLLLQVPGYTRGDSKPRLFEQGITKLLDKYKSMIDRLTKEQHKLFYKVLSDMSDKLADKYGLFYLSMSQKAREPEFIVTDQEWDILIPTLHQCMAATADMYLLLKIMTDNNTTVIINGGVYHVLEMAKILKGVGGDVIVEKHAPNKMCLDMGLID